MKKLTKLLIIIAIMIMTVTPVYVYGFEGNGSEGEGHTVQGGYAGEEGQFHGWVEAWSGYRLYIIDNETGFISESMAETDGIKVIDLVFGEVPTSDITINTETRYTYHGDYDVAHQRVYYGTVLNESLRSIPRPIVSPLKPNGIEFKAWMVATNSATGKANGLDLISNLFGEETLKTFIENDLSLVVETIIWTGEPKMKENRVTGEELWVGSPKWLYGTVYDWAKWFKSKGWDFDKTDSRGRTEYEASVYGAVACNSLVLANTVGKIEGSVTYGKKTIIIPDELSSTKKKVNSVLNCGYGIHIYTAEDIAKDLAASIHTYDEKLGIKIGKSPLPTRVSGITIVKRYETVNKDGKTLRIDGTYTRSRNPINITVNDETDETGYTVKDVRLSNEKGMKYGSAIANKKLTAGAVEVEFGEATT